MSAKHHASLKHELVSVDIHYKKESIWNIRGIFVVCLFKIQSELTHNGSGTLNQIVRGHDVVLN